MMQYTWLCIKESIYIYIFIVMSFIIYFTLKIANSEYNFNNNSKNKKYRKCRRIYYPMFEYYNISLINFKLINIYSNRIVYSINLNIYRKIQFELLKIKHYLNYLLAKVYFKIVL